MTVIMQVVKEEKTKTFRAEIRPSGLKIELWAKPEAKLICLHVILDEEAVQDLRTLCDITLQKIQEARWRATQAKEEMIHDNDN